MDGLRKGRQPRFLYTEGMQRCDFSIPRLDLDKFQCLMRLLPHFPTFLHGICKPHQEPFATMDIERQFLVSNDAEMAPLALPFLHKVQSFSGLRTPPSSDEENNPILRRQPSRFRLPEIFGRVQPTRSSDFLRAEHAELQRNFSAPNAPVLSVKPTSGAFRASSETKQIPLAELPASPPSSLLGFGDESFERRALRPAPLSYYNLRAIEPEKRIEILSPKPLTLMPSPLLREPGIQTPRTCCNLQAGSSERLPRSDTQHTALSYDEEHGIVDDYCIGADHKQATNDQNEKEHSRGDPVTLSKRISIVDFLKEDPSSDADYDGRIAASSPTPPEGVRDTTCSEETEWFQGRRPLSERRSLTSEERLSRWLQGVPQRICQVVQHPLSDTPPSAFDRYKPPKLVSIDY